MKKNILLLLLLFLFLCASSSLRANNGIVIGWHAGTGSSWSQSELGIAANHNRQLSVTATGNYVYGTSGNESTPGANWAYSLGWDGGSGSKGWVFPMTTAGFTNLTVSFYQKSRIQAVPGLEYGPRDFKLQYSMNNSTWTDVAGAGFVLSDVWKKFTVTLPAACENQPTLYLKWVMSSNTSINSGAIAPGALSDFGDFMMYGDEIPLPITALALSSAGIASNQPSGTTVGTFSVTDANVYDTPTYALVAGTGGADNAKFSITGSTLATVGILTAGSYSIRVQASDGTSTFTQVYTIVVSNYPVVVVDDPTWNADAYISRVQFGSIDQSSGMSGAQNAVGYSDYTSDIANVIRGTSHSLTITLDVTTSYGENIRVYTDWNHDYDLTDAGERVDLAVGSTATGTFSHTVSLAVPSDAAVGSTLMRVVVDNGGGLALGVRDYGEVEDYTVNIQNPTVSFTGGSAFTQSITPSAADQVLGRFFLTANAAGSTLTGAVVTVNNAHTGVSNLKLWASTDATFDAGSDTQLNGSPAADPGSGGTVAFTGISSEISTSGTYYFLTADVAAGATGTARGMIVDGSSLTVTGGTLSGTITNASLSTNAAALPVELASFTARPEGTKIVLNWETATELNNYGFDVERAVRRDSGAVQEAAPDGAWQKVAFMKGQGTSHVPTRYSYIDAPIGGACYAYRLKQIDADGVFSYSNERTAVVALPKQFSVEQNFPNPFNPTTLIRYSIASACRVSLKVFDVLGREAAVIVDELAQPGIYTAPFSMQTSHLPSGIYYYTLQAGGFSQTRKMIVMK